MRKLSRTLLTGAFLLCSASAFSQNWQLVWADEFTNSISTDWNIEVNGLGGYNNELEYYRAENLSIVNGELVITGKKEDFGGKNYTSGRLNTQNKKYWKYGKIEARISMPSFSGSWPAFWMLGQYGGQWPACGEIDIMEHINGDNNDWGTIHWADVNGNHVQYTNSTQVSSSVANYHTYSVEWDANSIKWYVDGTLFNTANIANNINNTAAFHSEFYIILNYAIGGDWPGFNIDNTALPAQMKIDYVRVYQDGGAVPQGPFGGTAWPIPGTVQAESYDVGGQDVAYNDVTPANEGNSTFRTDAVDIETCTDGTGAIDVGYIVAGEWLEYTVNVTKAAKYDISARVAAPTAGMTFHIEMDGQNVSGTIAVPATGGWDTWQTVTIENVALTAGNKVMRIVMETGDFNLNYVQFTQSVTTSINNGTLASNKLTYPNPTQGIVNVDNDATAIEIYTMNGTLLGTCYPNGVHQIDITNLVSNMYVLKIETPTYSYYSKIMKE